MSETYTIHKQMPGTIEPFDITIYAKREDDEQIRLESTTGDDGKKYFKLYLGNVETLNSHDVCALINRELNSNYFQFSKQDVVIDIGSGLHRVVTVAFLIDWFETKREYVKGLSIVDSFTDSNGQTITNQMRIF